MAGQKDLEWSCMAVRAELERSCMARRVDLERTYMDWKTVSSSWQLCN